MKLDLCEGLPDDELPLHPRGQNVGPGNGWGPAETNLLALLWADPLLSASAISLRLPGRTRNSIIRKAHALNLPPKAARPKKGEREPTSITNVHLRKVYASKGDDATLSRFVKVDPGPMTPKPRQMRLPGTDLASVEAGRSIFWRHGVKPPSMSRPKSATSYRVLVSAHNNAKIGRDVRRGKLAGYWIYTLSLEERATCPRTCEHWGNCYGNGMPYARRVDHRDPALLEQAIAADVADILAVRGRRGALIRLHALGDFFSTSYVDFWALQVATHDRLAVFGYTAHPPGSRIGDRVAFWRERLGFDRFAIRHSDGGTANDCTVSVYELTAPSNAVLCPEQARGVTAAGKPILCATCAICWTTRRNIAFVNH